MYWPAGGTAANRSHVAWKRTLRRKFQALFGVDHCPHGDTLNVAFGRLNPDQVQTVITALARTLIRKKVLDRYRLLGRYFVIAVDGTGRLVFPERHCPHCLTMTHNGKTIYHHPVLEAKRLAQLYRATRIETKIQAGADRL